jgi:hypothetical protein
MRPKLFEVVTWWLGREDSNLRVAETASFQLHAHSGAFPRFSARNAMPRERPPQRRGCAQKGRPLRGGPTGASGKRIHGAIWHIGEAGVALPTVRLADASGVGWTPDAPEA